MCSPKVMQTVNERLAEEHKHQVSRRNFLRLGGITAGGIAVASLAPLSAPKRAMAQEMTGEIVDLSHVFATTVPTYVLGEAPTREDHVTIEANGYYIQKWTLFEHAGTHVDIPAHFIAGGETVDVYNPANLIAPAVVIDIAAKAETDPDAMVMVQDIQAWESANGDLPENAVVFMYSGWESKWADVDATRNADESGTMHFPGFSPEAATYLTIEKNIRGIGVDTLSLDYGASTTFDVHVTILGAGKFGVEGVANLAAIKDAPATVFVGVPRWEEGSGGPARVLAMK